MSDTWRAEDYGDAKEEEPLRVLPFVGVALTWFVAPIISATRRGWWWRVWRGCLGGCGKP